MLSKEAAIMKSALLIFYECHYNFIKKTPISLIIVTDTSTRYKNAKKKQCANIYFIEVK